LETLLTITYTVFFIFIIHKMKFFNVDGISKKMISGIFILKILSGLALWAIYTFYYTDRSTADIYKYFDDSKILFDLFKTNPIDFLKILTGIGNNTPEFHPHYAQMHYWARQIDSGIYNDSHTIIRFNTLMRLFSFGYYNVHTVFICFLSLIGLTAIYKTFIPYLKDKPTELMIAVFFLPSVLFWGSGVLKEGLIFFALGLLIYHFHKLFNIRSLLICLGTALLLALSKFYVWLSILPGLLFILWINKSKNKNVVIKFLAVILILTIAGLNIDRFTSIQNPLITLSQKQIEFNKLAYGNATDAYNKPIPIANSVIKIDTLEPSFSSFIKNSPKALVNTFFRPFVWELKTAMMVLAGVENSILLVFMLLCIIFIKPLASIHWEYVLFCFSFALIQFLIIGETVPILGAITRYKVPALPFLVIAFLFLLDKEKFRSRFNYRTTIK
jgi:hypothetical protein